MLNLVEEQRMEQSRYSYNSQTEEEFHNLNTNLQTYLNDSKRIDDENRQLQNIIEQIRTNYIKTLENHLKRLPEDFRQESQILTEAHLERYKSKSRAKRFINEREELKKRINFISNDEKEQIKRLNNLQKQERLVHNEFKNLNEQMKNLYNYLEREKQTHRQAMDKVDHLQTQLEQSCIERSKTEFEIQTLREEVQLMRTAKEFLDDEYQTILSTQTEANEYLLSSSNDSVSRIREDFDELNKTQLKQIENEYKQMMKTLEENSLTNANAGETTINHQRTSQNDSEKLQDEYQSITQELSTLNDHNHILSQRVLAMEADLYIIRDERMRELTTKDNEVEHSRIELQTLNEKLSYLSEYDRNLKFELTLYRGVLESEYRRKQQQLNNNQQPMRPTTITRNNKNSSVLKSRNQLESISEKISTQFDETKSTRNHPEDEKIENKETLKQQESLSQGQKKSFNENEPGKIKSTTVTSQEEHQTPKETPRSSISSVLADEQSSSEVQLLSTNHEASVSDRRRSSETLKSPTSLTASTQLKGQPASFDGHQSPITSSKTQTISADSSPNDETSLISTPVISSDAHQSLSTPSEDRQISTNTLKLSSILPSTGSEILSGAQETPTISDEQHESSEIPQLSATQLDNQHESFEILQISSVPIEDQRKSSELHQTPLAQLEDHHTSFEILQTPSVLVVEDQHEPPELHQLPRTEPDDQHESSEILQAPSVPVEDQRKSSELHQIPLPQLEDQHESSEILQTPSVPLEDQQKSSEIPETSATQLEDQHVSSEILQTPSVAVDNQQKSPELYQTPSVLSEDQHKPSEVLETPATQVEDQHESSKLHQPSSAQLKDHHESSEILETPSVPVEDRQKSSEILQTSSTQPEDQHESSELHQSSSTQLEDQHESSKILQTPLVPVEGQQKSSNILGTPSPQLKDQHESSEILETPAPQLEDQQESSELHQKPSKQLEDQQLSITSPMDEQTPSETEKSSISPTNTAPPRNLSISFEAHQTTSNRQVSGSTSSNDDSTRSQPSSTPSEEDRPISPNIHQETSTSSQEQRTSPELQQSSMTDENVQDQPLLVIADEYQPANLTGEVDGENQLSKSSNAYDKGVELEETTASSTHETHEVAINENDTKDRRPSIHSIEPSAVEEHETNQSAVEDITKTEEQFSSSDQNEIEEDSKTGYLSSSGYYGTLNDSTHSSNQELNKESSRKTSLTDVEDDNIDLVGEADKSTSPKIQENDVDDDNESSLEAVMQDLRCVYRDLANEEDLVEIDDDFPDNLVERLEFGDNVIRTLFDGLLRKYIIQPVKFQIRSKTLDWIEFRDILFPILTGRYMESHIRKFFDLFDTSKDGYLSFQEITELLELLQVSNATELAQYMITEFDKNQDGKLNIDEFIDAVKRADDVHDNILPDDMEYKHWYIQHPLEEEDNDTQSISLEVPIVNFSSKTNSSRTEIINNQMILLGRIFKRVGADAEYKQLDSNKPTLSMKITNEFIHNNINISNDDLHLFIDLYLNKKQNSDRFISWIEFRDIFLPFVNGGMFSNDDIIHWFDILDTNHNKLLTREQILQLLRLLQFSKPENIFEKINGISETYTNNNGTWTLDELLFAFEQIDETTTHLLPTNELITSFDREWLTKNIF